ncbi:MAG: hypothetical protein ACLFTK_11390 [Anaerolineales bacterium]
MSKRYRLLAYTVQLNAMLLLLMGLALTWHTQHGSGYYLLGYIPTAQLAPGIWWQGSDGRIDFSITPWWLFYGIPAGALGLGVRAALGLALDTVDARQQRWVLAGLLGAMLVGLGWFYVAEFEALGLGYALGVVTTLTLIGGLGVEATLPDMREDERRFSHLPPDHPERVKYGFTRQCPACAAYNDPAAKWCWHCGLALHIE